jgi:hypothetical protein
MRIAGWDGSVGDVRWWARALSFAAVMGAIIALLGPYGSFYNDLSLRLIDWIAILSLGTLIYGSVIPPIVRIGTAAGLPRFFTFALALALAAIPAAAVSSTVSKFFWGQHVTEYRWHDWYLQTLLLGAITIVLWAFVEIARLSLRAQQSAPGTAPVSLSADVLCLQMEDHYVRVHRTAGSSLELMPLHEAVRRYGEPHGLQVHRGWWVASGAVEAAERDVRKWRLRLRNGLIVPVARNRIGDVRRHGWLN